MAATITTQDAAELGNLSEAQILQMLQDAERRLRSAGKDNHSLLTSNNVRPQQDCPRLRLNGGKQSFAPLIATKSSGATVDASQIISAEHRKLANSPRIVDDLMSVKMKGIKEKKANAGSDWYNLPRTNLTPELKRDLQLLRMRSVLDPKRHYKKDNSNKNYFPEFSQVGTVIEGPTEYFSARLKNKERKRTLVEEVLEGEKNSQRFKSKYREIQEAKTSGKKAHYTALQARRRSKG